MLVGLGLMVAALSGPLAEVTPAVETKAVVSPAAESGLALWRAARSLARASRAAESAGDLPAALDLARESYVLRPTRRALQRVDGLKNRVQDAPLLRNRR